MADNADKHPDQILPSTDIILKRRLYTQLEYNDTYKEEAAMRTFRDSLRSACSCSKHKVLYLLLSALPIVNVIRRYRPKQDIVGDILGGLSAAFLHLPQGLAFGLLASLAPVNGLYSSFFPVLFYVVFGTCPHISFGTNALIALLTSNVVDREAEFFLTSASNATGIQGDEILNYKVGVAMSVTLLSGLILLAMGMCRLGFVTMYLSVSFIGGFTTASAVHITTSQISKMLKIKIKARSGPGKVILTYVDIFKNIAKANPADIIIALISFAILLGVKIGINEKFSGKMKIPVPIDLILVIIGTLISHFATLNKRFGVAVIGAVPSGMPIPSVPPLDVIPRIVPDSFVIAIIIFAMAIAMAKLMARKHDYNVNDNQELIAYGISNFASSFFRCFPSTTAPPRTMILSSLGSRTPLNGILSAVFILIILLAAGPLFVSLPIALLAVMVVVAIKDLLLQTRQLPNLWRTSKADFVMWLVTFLVCVFVDLDYGIISGVAVSFLTVIVHTQLASGSLRHLSAKEDVLIPRSEKQRLKELSGIRVFYFNAILFFANAEKFRNEIFEKVFNPSNRKRDAMTVNKDKPSTDANLNESNEVCKPLTDQNEHTTDHIHHIIIDCSSMTYIDIAGVNVLQLVISKYSNIDIHVYLACCNDFMWKILNRTGFFETFSKEHVFYEVWDAVEAAQQAQTVVSKDTIEDKV